MSNGFSTELFIEPDVVGKNFVDGDDAGVGLIVRFSTDTLSAEDFAKFYGALKDCLVLDKDSDGNVVGAKARVTFEGVSDD